MFDKVKLSPPPPPPMQVAELSDRFNLERITKSPAVFDKVKLSWMNGQHLKGLGEEEVRGGRGGEEGGRGFWMLNHPLRIILFVS